MQLFMSYQDYANAMEFTRQEWANDQMLTHICHGPQHRWTHRRQLDIWKTRFLETNFGRVPSGGIICALPHLGWNYFCGLLGMAIKDLTSCSQTIFSSEIEGIPQSVPNAVPDSKDKS